MAAENLLGSWNDTSARQEIVDFVQSASTEGSAGFAAPPERVAVFDNDGTLWSEKPIPIQLDFTLFRMAELADSGPVAAGPGSRTRPRSSGTTGGWATRW